MGQLKLRVRRGTEGGFHSGGTTPDEWAIRAPVRGTAFRFALEGNRNEPLAGDGAVSEKLFAASDVIASARGRLRNWVARGNPAVDVEYRQDSAACRFGQGHKGPGVSSQGG